MANNILMISPVYFNYYKQMIEELNSLGFEVDWFSDRPTQNNFFKAVSRINPNIVENSVKPYFNSIIEKIRNKKYDYVFFVRGMSYCFSDDMMKQLKETLPKAVFLSYQWDSMFNLKNIESFWNFFDRSYSFDRIDANNNEKLRFLPLFYDRDYGALSDKKPKNDNDFKYDCCYVGTAHPKKYKMIEEMSEKLSNVYKNQFIYHYMPSKLKFYYHKFKNVEYKNARFNKFKTETLSKPQTMDVVLNSKCVLDSPQDNQNGATMRVIECLGSSTKLITTNKDLVNYDFYKPENIYIYDGDFDFNNIFFSSDYSKLDDEIYEKYSLSGWLKQIFEL